MFTLTTAAWLFAISIAACFGFLLGAMFRIGAKADADEIRAKPRKRRRTIIS
jgi:hypothetical protein